MRKRKDASANTPLDETTESRPAPEEIDYPVTMAKLDRLKVRDDDTEDAVHEARLAKIPAEKREEVAQVLRARRARAKAFALGHEEDIDW